MTRKARAFNSQMRELRALGYTFDAIRQALEAAGVQVSIATVQRELRQPVNRGLTPPMPPAATVSTPSVRAPATFTGPLDSRSGKEVAETFHAQHISNPLLRAKQAAKDAK